MDILGEQSLLLTATYIATAVLLTVGNDRWDECDLFDHLICRSSKFQCPDSHPVLTTTQHYWEFPANNTTFNYSCGNLTISDEGSWFKVQRCGKYVRTKELEENLKPFLFFDNGLCPLNQGKYFCVMNGTDKCTISTSTTVVTMKGVDTYRGTFKLPQHRQGNSCHGKAKMRCIETSVNNTLCSKLPAGQCKFSLEHLTSKSGLFVEGYLYLKDTLDINSIQTNHSVNGPYREVSFACGSRDGDGEDLANMTFHQFSFCESESVYNDSAGNLTFPKTNIGRNASSQEICEDGTPRASRLCQGDFLQPSSWAEPKLIDCTATDTYANVIVTTTDDNLMAIPSDTPPTEVSKDATKRQMIVSATSMKKYTINDVPVRKENVHLVSRKLSENMKNPQNVNASQLMWASERLKNISEIGSPSPEVTRHVMEIVDNLVNVNDDVYEVNLSEEAPAIILRALETQLTNLHNGNFTNFTDVKSSLGVAARQFERRAFKENVTFGGMFLDVNDSSEDKSKVSVMTGNDKLYSNFLATITLPTNLLDKIPAGHIEIIPVTFIIHRTSRLFRSSSSHKRNQRRNIESTVIAATVEGHSITNLSNPVITKFKVPNVEDKIKAGIRKCVFWDFSLNNGRGDWSFEGCTLARSSEDNSGSIIECHCNHLTNFAVLLDAQGDIGHITLDILSIIGCVVSIIALFITIVILLAVKKLRQQVPQQIIINLCFALLGLYICFLVGIDQSNLGTGCIIFGALIHYFCLASVAWMCVVATNMYLLFVRVFNADVTGFMWKAFLAAWGLPMIAVVVSVVLKHHDYTSIYCFPKAGTPIFLYGVLLLIGLMLFYNLVIFVLIIRQVTCGRIGKPVGKDIRAERIERAQSIIIISVLLGLTWVFGFFSIGGVRFIFNLLFLVFNSLQGLLVFIVFILKPENVRLILFKSCYRLHDGTIGSYTVSKSKSSDAYDQKDTVDMDADIATTSQACDSNT